MNKKVYVIDHVHMDLSWRRGYGAHFDWQGNVIRPYGELEAAQIARQLDMCEASGYHFSIEQTAVLEGYLQLHPDELPRIRKAVQAGKLQLLGGGQAVIDTNLVSGESLLRNQLHGLEKAVALTGKRPRYACLVDLFGLSAQLPQLVDLLGYEGIAQYSRVFPNEGRYWRGLDGTVTLLGCNERTVDGYIRYYCDCPTCPVCHGEGCSACGGLGIESAYNRTEGPQFARMRELAQQWQQQDKDTFALLYQTEEGMPDEHLHSRMQAIFGEYGIDVEWIGYDEMIDFLYAQERRALREGKIDEALVDPRVEGNPQATGCYTSRIRLKQLNRESECRIQAAETLAAFAGTDHPTLELKQLWDRLFFTQFHDCITASHGDPSYGELLREHRLIRMGTEGILQKAMKKLAAQVNVPAREGWQPFLLFNPQNSDVAEVPLTYSFFGEGEGWRIADSEGTPLTVTDVRSTQTAGGTYITVTFLGRLPAMGHALFYRKSCEELPGWEEAQQVSNAVFTLTEEGVFTADGKKLCGLPGLAMSRDVGDPWGRMQPEIGLHRLKTSNVWMETVPGGSRLIMVGLDKKVDWQLTLTLYSDVKKIFVDVQADWRGDNDHLYLDVPLAEEWCGEAVYEIPFGTVARGAYTGEKLNLGHADEWSGLNWFAVPQGEQPILWTKGLSGMRVAQGSMQVSLLRAPGVNSHNTPCTEKVNDHGTHNFACAIGFGGECWKNADPAAYGLAFNMGAFGCEVQPQAGKLPAVYTRLGGGYQVAAVKRTEEGRIAVRTYEPYGGTLPAPAWAAEETDVFEQKRRPADGLAPYRIKTYIAKE